MSPWIQRFSGLVLLASLLPLLSLAQDLPAVGSDSAPAIQVRLRTRTIVSADQPAVVNFQEERWEPDQTAVIVCDMWDAHHCLNAVRRELQLAPRMNQFLEKLRRDGALIIHAPSSCMSAYENHPGRKVAMNAPLATNLPTGISEWCNSIPAEERGTYPLDQSDGGEDDDLAEHEQWHEQLASQGRNPKAPWQKQIDLIDIAPGDAISDSGVEIWNLLESRGISQVMLVGVHTNMCVLGRPFGLRNLSQAGKKVVLVRDLTDTMYNPKRWPYVSHFTGTDRIVRHIETYVCPTISSEQILGGQPFRFRQDTRPHLVCLLAEDEYQTERTVPQWLESSLASTFRISYVFASPDDPQSLAGWQCLPQADALLISVRRKALPREQLEAIQSKIRQGVPIIGLRTASHAFSLREGETPEGRSQWPEFDAEVLGGNYHLHHGNKEADDPATFVWSAEAASSSGWSAVLPKTETRVTSWLYKTEPLAPGATILLMGRVGDRLPHEPVAWTHVNRFGGRVFYTSLGHPEDFQTDFFPSLLKQAVLWSVNRASDDEVPQPPAN